MARDTVHAARSAAISRRSGTGAARLRGVELARRGTARRAVRGGAGGPERVASRRRGRGCAGLARGGRARAASSARGRREPAASDCRPASASSIACSAGGSCPARWCCSAARRGSASRRSRTWRSATSRAPGISTLYVSGEESAEQVRLRAERLHQGALEVPMLAETDLDAVLDTLASHAPRVCVIDSVQTSARRGAQRRARRGRAGARGGRRGSWSWPRQRHRGRCSSVT